MLHRGADLELNCTEAVIKCKVAEEIWMRKDAECDREDVIVYTKSPVTGQGAMGTN